MEDVVDYKIPLGWMGQLAHFIFVKNRLKKFLSIEKTSY